MKKLLAMLLCVTMTVVTFTGCEMDEVREKAQSFASSASEAIEEWDISDSGTSLEGLFDDAVSNLQEKDDETEKEAKEACKKLTVWSGATAESFDGGSGTYEDPYQISNGEQLAKLSDDSNNGVDFEGVYFILTSDILLNDVSEWNFSNLEANSETVFGWNSFEPIGLNYRFEGNFDGNGYTIYGLCNTYAYYLKYGSPNIGLFGWIQNGSISNLNITCVYFATSSNSTSVTGGFLAGCVYTNTSIVNCHVNQAVYVSKGNSGTVEMGGICGRNGCEEILSCSVENALILFTDEATMYRAYIGGIGGYMYECTAVDCYGDCDIVISKELYYDGQTPTVYAGGICAYGTAEGCYSTGDINLMLTEGMDLTDPDIDSGSSVHVGGICASALGISNCGCTGTISYSGDIEDIYIGGIAGSMRDTSIQYSYSNMSIELDDSSSAVVGGVVGTVVYKKSGESNQIISCFYNSDYATKGIGQSTTSVFSNNVYGFTLKELKDASNYYDWDFDRTWVAKSGVNNGLPVLKSLVEYF